MGIVEDPRHGLENLGPDVGECEAGLVPEHPVTHAREKEIGKGARPVATSRPDRRAGHVRVLVLEQPSQRLLEDDRQPLGEPGRLPTRLRTLRPLLGDHRLEHQPRSILSLLSEPRQDGDNRRADRGVGEVAEVLHPGYRIHVGVAGQVEQRLGPDVHAGIGQEGLDALDDRPIPGVPENLERPATHLGRRVVEQSLYPRMRGLVGVSRHEIEGVEDLLGIHALQARREDVGGGAVEDRRARPLQIEAVLRDALLESPDVAAIGGRGHHEPGRDERQRHPGQLYRPQAPEGQKGQYGEPRQAVPGPPDDGVDERLRRQLQGKRHREVEQLHRRAVDRVAHHLVGGSERHRRSQRAEHEKAGRAQQEPQREQEEHRSQAHVPENPGGHQQLNHEAGRAHRGFDRSEERGQVIGGVLGPGHHEDVPGQGLVLPPGDGRDPRGQGDHPGDGPQVR